MVPRAPSAVDRLNALPLEQYAEALLPAKLALNLSAGSRRDDRDENKDVRLVFESSKSISREDLRDCFELVETTSAADYMASSIDWSPAGKRKEMRLPDLRYILVKCRGGSRLQCTKSTDDAELIGADAQPWRVEGFTSFMLTYEDGYEVLYCYEIHLAAKLRGLDIGRQLMSLLESVGSKARMQKTMLTVFNVNKAAHRFYKRLGYHEDEYSPGPRKLRNGVVKQPDYAILSKPVVGEACEAVDKRARLG